jgi:NAD(P)-dependent dehydrogenase (short-subunit alcohol dehydrogenase family)
MQPHATQGRSLSMASFRSEMETNFFGTLLVTRAFAPHLIALDGVEAGFVEILAEDLTRSTKAQLSADRGAVSTSGA